MKSRISKPGEILKPIPRRRFLAGMGTAAVAVGAGLASPFEESLSLLAERPAETSVKLLYDSLTPEQLNVIGFDWAHQDPRRGLLRTRVSNNWNITKPTINSDFFNGDQKELIRSIYEGVYHPEWIEKIDRQLKDDAGGYGNHQSIAIFGRPGHERFEFVMTGRHQTIRCDGNTTEHVAFGGPIFYGHAAQGFNEKPDHPGNVYWPQAIEANRVYEMLDGKQRDIALVDRRPRESDIDFRGADGEFSGIPIDELSGDQAQQVQKTLRTLIAPFRETDQQEVLQCLKAQGGLAGCSLAFYRSGDIGSDEVWDNWRLEGPSFVWYFRGSPHVHVWVNVASDSRVVTNAR